MIFRAKEMAYTAYYHRLKAENGKIYCRALGAVTEKDENFCHKCPLSAKHAGRHICFYFDLIHDEDFSPEKEKIFHDGIIYAGISPRFPIFAALSERWGEMNNNAFLNNWEYKERVDLENAFNKAAEYYKDSPQKMRECIERAFEVSISTTSADEIAQVTAEILKGIE